jgi:FkbM family methyltransferase
MINKFLSMIDNSFFRPLIKLVIILNYRRKGIALNKVKYFKEFKKWYYMVDGISFLSTSAGWAYSYQFLLDEAKNISCFYYLPKEGDVVVDLGAGIGEETIIFSKLTGEKGSVYSIEAHPQTYGSLKYIIEDNKFKNVFLFNCAISDNNAKVRIEDDHNNYLGNSIGENIESNHKGYFEVPSFTLDAFVSMNSIKKIDLLKVNIEGAEQLMIKGMTSSVKVVKNLAISCHDFRYNKGEGEFYKTKNKVIEFLLKNGFNIQSRNSGHVVWDDYVYASSN